MKSPSLDLTVFGATSFVGQILARYLFAQFGAHDGLKWALAGRSDQKLQRLRSSLGPKAAPRGKKAVVRRAPAPAARKRAVKRKA